MADTQATHPDEQLLIAPAGTVAIFNSHTWHGGTLNRTDKPRRGIHSYWTRRAHRQQLCQRDYLSAETRASLSAPIRYLLGVDGV